MEGYVPVPELTPLVREPASQMKLAGPTPVPVSPTIVKKNMFAVETYRLNKPGNKKLNTKEK